MPFFDHVNNELERRFPGDQRQMMLGQSLTLRKSDYVVASVVDELSNVYRVDLSDFSHMETRNSKMENEFHDGFENNYIVLQQSLKIFTPIS
jgi:hypothetical protein